MGSKKGRKKKENNINRGTSVPESTEPCPDNTSLSCDKTNTDPWSSLQGAVLLLIAGKIGSVDDYVRFSAVCRRWYSLATSFYTNTNHKLNLGPLYLSGADPKYSRRITLRNPATDTTLARVLPETAGSRCWGSPFGWAITYYHRFYGPTFSLVNPVTGATIPLPDLPEGCEKLPETVKAFLTASPESDPDDYLVLAVFGYHKVALARPGGKSWSGIHGNLDLFDLALHRGNLYGIEYSSTCDVLLFLFELNQPERKGKLVHRAVHILTLNLNLDPWSRYLIDASDKHLVDLNGELCMCVLYHSSDSTVTNALEVFKIDLSDGSLTKVSSLGDHCLFLGDNYSFAHKASCPPDKIFEQPHHGLHEFVSNYVFYAHYRHSCGATGYANRPFDVEVWDVSSMNPRKVCSRIMKDDDEDEDDGTPQYGPTWILPSISFRELEGYDHE